jgi:molybdopterin synthase catalytic subunit
MMLSPLRQLSDMPYEFEPTDALATTLELSEVALAEKILEAVAMLHQFGPLQMQQYLSNLVTLLAEHRQACGNLLCVDVRRTGEKAFDAGRVAA